MTSISLQSVAHHSRPTLDRLGEPGNGATIENGRIGINDKGQLVVFKGKAFLLHLQQCYRAEKLIKANDLSTHTSTSLRAALRFKDLRLGTQSTDTLIRRMNLANALRKIVGASEKTVRFESLLAGMPGKILSRGGPRSPHSQANVRITTQPPMALQELKGLASTADNGDAIPAATEHRAEPEQPTEATLNRIPVPKPRPTVPVNAPTRPPRKIDSPFMHHPLPSSPSPSTASSHSFEFLPGTPPQAASDNAPTSARSIDTSPAFLDALHQAGVAKDALIRTMLVNSGS
ncbi:hypothetical protein [Pandoraea oxalativorans]|uniref:Uncharacterized protein n=1 Tax=Pandoraea oxalativorans TaxID=573737 RepID=A0A0E3YBW5_9BURK|nr:hypothetical protein [Pandoraea oxalativorans]AKC69030.1 hypothetical protein MB84_05445 [Pandoraea oxalativorans]